VRRRDAGAPPMGGGSGSVGGSLAGGRVEYVLEIPNRHVGGLIGKGGETVQMLQQRTGANIQITKDSEADPNSTTRSVALMGTQVQVDECRRLVMELIEKAGDGSITTSNAASGMPEEVITIPSTCVGMIIGRAGATIQMLQQQVCEANCPPQPLSRAQRPLLGWPACSLHLGACA
jgi:far upstream element-binding protein